MYYKKNALKDKNFIPYWTRDGKGNIDYWISHRAAVTIPEEEFFKTKEEKDIDFIKMCENGSIFPLFEFFSVMHKFMNGDDTLIQNFEEKNESSLSIRKNHLVRNHKLL